MANEESERCEIDDLKAEEKRTAEEEVYAKFAELEQEKAKEQQLAGAAKAKKAKSKAKKAKAASVLDAGGAVLDDELDDDEMMAEILDETSAAMPRPSQPKPPKPPAEAEAKRAAAVPKTERVIEAEVSAAPPAHSTCCGGRWRDHAIACPASCVLS